MTTHSLPKNLTEVGERMLSVLDERGWHQGSLIDWDTGAVCMHGALRFAVAGRIDFARKENLIACAGSRLDHEAIRLGYTKRITRPSACFNDDPATSLEDVKLFIKRALFE